jgi:hypothetical protein
MPGDRVDWEFGHLGFLSVYPPNRTVGERLYQVVGIIRVAPGGLKTQPENAVENTTVVRPRIRLVGQHWMITAHSYSASS